MEITATLKFTTPCLGNIRKPDYDRMQRDPDGNVIFLPSWWRAAFAQAAKATNQHYGLVDKVRPAPVVVGQVSKVKRRYGRRPDDTHAHEGFDEGAVIKIKFALPPGVAIAQFKELLQAVGSYVGFSPYRQEDYGFFAVVSVEAASARRKGRAGGSRQNPEGGKPGPSHSAIR